jgi:hypothetical protein
MNKASDAADSCAMRLPGDDDRNIGRLDNVRRLVILERTAIA